MKKDKINLALLWLRYDGGVTSVGDLVLRLDKEHFNVIFIYLTRYGVETNIIGEAGYDVVYLSEIERIKIFRFSILCRLVRILKEHNVDILHCHGHKPALYGALAARFAKTPVILSHVHGLGRSKNLKRKLAYFLLFGSIVRFIAVANSVKEDILRSNWLLSSEKLTVLENSVDYERFAKVSISKEDAKRKLGLPSDAFVFGTIARFGPYKGHKFLISGLEKVQNEVPSAHLLLIGEGPLKEDVQKQVTTAGIDQSVHFLGQRNDIPELLRAMDAFVLPSVGSEGMPRVLLEAMAADVPCIATNVGGIAEIISSNDVGVLIPPEDSEALADEMIKLTKMTPKKRQKLIDNARQRIYSHYSHDVVMRKLEKIYEAEIAHYL